MKRRLRPFTATRRCPHRWCQPLHRGTTGIGTVVIIGAFVANPLAQAVMLMFAFLVAMAIMQSKFGPGTQGRVAHQTAGPGGSAKTEIVVDHRWATIAAATDVVLFAAAILDVTVLGLRGTSVYGKPHTIPADIGWILIIATSAYLSVVYAHWRATRPRPRRRVRVWVQRFVPAFAGGR